MELYELREKLCKSWIVQLITFDVGGESYGISLPISALIEDWYGNCSWCPENGEHVYSVVFFSTDGKCYPLLQPESVTFEELMRELEKVIYFNKR